MLTKSHPPGQRYPVLKYQFTRNLVIRKNTMTLKYQSISYSGSDVVVAGWDVVKTDPDPPAA